MLTRVRDRFPVSPRRFRQVAALILGLLVVIVFTGAAVRVTGSGLGCPTWPKCTEETIYTESTSAPSLIEFGNRVITVVISLAVVAGILMALLRKPFRRDLLAFSVLVLAGVLAQAVLGGLSVLYHLAPGFIMGHYGLSMLVIIAGYGLWWRAREDPYEDPVRNPRDVILGARGLLALGGVAVFLGTASTAAGPHAGGSGTNDVVTRLYFKGSDTLSFLVTVHGVAVTLLGFAAVGLWWLARRSGAQADVRTILTRLCLLLALQGVLGIVQYQLELPNSLVWIHVILATLTWVGLVRLWAAAGPIKRDGQPTVGAATENPAQVVRAPEPVGSR